LTGADDRQAHAYLTDGQTWARRDGEAGRDLALFTRGDPADAALMPALAAYGIDRRVMFSSKVGGP